MRHKKNPEEPKPLPISDAIKVLDMQGETQSETAHAKRLQLIMRTRKAIETALKKTPGIAFILGGLIPMAYFVATSESRKDECWPYFINDMIRTTIGLIIGTAAGLAWGMRDRLIRRDQVIVEENTMQKIITSRIQNIFGNNVLKRKLGDNTVVITRMSTDQKGEQQKRRGAGCIIDTRTILTAKHCVDDASDASEDTPEDATVRITGASSNSATRKIQRIIRHPHRDLALIIFSKPIVDKEHNVLKIAASRPEKDTAHLTMGHPSGNDFRISPLLYKGTETKVIDSDEGRKTPEEYYTMQGETYAGNSGGPVINEKGELIGIVCRGTGMMSAVTHVAPVIPTEIAALKRIAIQQRHQPKP